LNQLCGYQGVIGSTTLAGSGPSGGHWQCAVLQVLGQFDVIGHAIFEASAASLNERLGHFEVFHTSN